ncbi:hypothetical protein [Cryobacterium sp. Y57]|uniref:hypothetical protein n=1 Tax=Cryobacterium sp. Y57 TaxID=2048287 RepID=UPI0011B0B9BB|nr:hypothetical protein [Cryobacterium sp. Y57]
MAPSINRKYGPVAITVDDLIAEGESWNVRAPRLIITSALEAVDAFVRSEGPVARAYAGLQDDVARFTQNHLRRCPKGSVHKGRLDAHTYIQRLLPRDRPRWAEVLK